MPTNDDEFATFNPYNHNQKDSSVRDRKEFTFHNNNDQSNEARAKI